MNTQNTPIYPVGLRTCIDEQVMEWFNGEVVGTFVNHSMTDSPELTVKRSTRHCSVWLGNELVAFTSFDDGVVDEVMVIAKFRNTRSMSQLLEFYVTGLGYDRLTIAQPNASYIDNLMQHLHQFKKFWVNQITGESIDYKAKDYTLIDLSVWDLVIEQDFITRETSNTVAAEAI